MSLRAQQHQHQVSHITLVGIAVLGLLASSAAANSLPDELTDPARGEALLTSVAIETLLAHAELHLDRQQPGLALRLYRQVPESSTWKSRALLGEGCCLFALGKYESSARILRTVRSRLDGNDGQRELLATSLELLGQDYLYLGQTSYARRIYRDLAQDFPARSSYCAVMVAKTHLQDGSFRSAYKAVEPVLLEGKFMPAYEFGLELYWKLDSRDRHELSRLLERFLAITQKEYTGRG
jgi:tetratricopeptide (TPR) repeat protein